ncbi:MAG TPA: hemerythrin domain-containing protein [Aquabacterium sp.]|nr:hemerythrin domain-containing protein [Aquabacterium sp.]
MVLLHTPPPSFEDPIEMLTACHDKVRHFARLSTRLAEHLQQHGVDKQAQDAAGAVLRYFDLAAPLHHADEDEDLFPALLALNDPTLSMDIQRLSAEHATLASLWHAVRSWLLAVQNGDLRPPPSELALFAQRYPQHALDEERLIYPHAQRLSEALRSELGRNMAHRRQH